MYSAIEVANAVGSPLVKWVVLGLNENRTDDVHAKIREITGVDMKIASLFLRDVAFRFRAFPPTSRWLLQPVDIWVRRSASLLGATGDDPAVAKFIVEIAKTGSCEPEKVNQGMWYFGAEIAGSEYRLRRTLSDLNKSEDLLGRHLTSLSRASKADSYIVKAVQSAGRIKREIDKLFGKG
jgi:hypothetical protein